MDLVHVQTGFTHEAFMGGRHKHLAKWRHAEGTSSYIGCLVYISLFSFMAFLDFKSNNGILGVKEINEWDN